MIGYLVFLVLVLVEVVIVFLSFRKKSNAKRTKSIIRIVLFTLFLVLVISPMINWGFIWMMLGVLMGLQAILGILVLVRQKGDKPVKKSRVIMGFIGRVFVYGVAVFPILLFPPYDLIKTTGDYPVSTKSFTWTDDSREELFTEVQDDKRKVTIQFWFPSEEKDENFPLVVFSHGAFGLRSSNYSTFQEMASNGYIVASIDHTYHAFMTEQTDGEKIFTNMDFINDAIKATNGDIKGEDLYVLEQEWMKLRTEDMLFVMNRIKDQTVTNTDDQVFQLIDLEHIGVLGHSLGGATAAEIGRIDDSVDAVIVLDGTMLGEIIRYEDNREIFIEEPYPKPILNFYNESHYEAEAKGNEEYPNTVAHNHALDSYQVVIKKSDHMNFTDLPIISPILASLLGTGEVDTRECTEKINDIILQFFDCYLKDTKSEIERERIF